MKVGDLVKLKSADPVLPTLGLIISIEDHYYGPVLLQRARVRWFRGSFSEYCYMSNLEAVSESR